MAYFSDMEEHKPGRDVLLAFNEDIGSALHKACEHDADSDDVHLARAANIVRRDMLKMKTAFSGSFDALCQEQSVPKSLLALVAMILNGPTIQEQSSHSTPTLTISQLLMFNSYARRRQSTSIRSITHGHNRETPLPVYLGMLIHTKTRKRDLVDTLFYFGLSVSVPPMFLGKREPPMPKLAGPNRSDCQLIPQAMQVEYRYATENILSESCT